MNWIQRGEIPFPSIIGRRKPCQFLRKRNLPFGAQQAEQSLSSTANKLADQRAESAVVAILTPICVEKFQQSGNAIANLAALRNISSSWEQGNFVEKGGWATRPGATSPDYILARACAEKLVQPKSAAQ